MSPGMKCFQLQGILTKLDDAPDLQSEKFIKYECGDPLAILERLANGFDFAPDLNKNTAEDFIPPRLKPS